MAFFRSPFFRRIIYAIAFALALTRFAGRSHAETLPPDDPARPAIAEAAR